MLQAEGIECRSFESGASFFLSGRPENNSIVLLDILLPKQDGFAVFEEMKSRNIDGTVVFMSGLSDSMILNMCVERGAVIF